MLLGVLVVAGGGLALTELLTPSVSDASARVAALDASHHTHPVSVVATDRIALATVDWSDYPLRSAHTNGVYLLTEDEARRIAKGIARLPELLKRRFPWRNWKAA